jgi:CRP/FNR family transcriptional regulator
VRSRRFRAAQRSAARPPRRYSSSELYLRMTRDEMGSYLGMKLETVSRMFSKFQKEGIVDTHGKQVRIVDFGRLANV